MNILFATKRVGNSAAGSLRY